MLSWLRPTPDSDLPRLVILLNCHPMIVARESGHPGLQSAIACRDSYAAESRLDPMADHIVFIKEQVGFKKLKTFSARVAEILSLTEFQERESSNYAEGHYFKGLLGGSVVRLYYLDTTGFEEWLFAIQIKTPHESVAHDVASAVAAAGFQCFVPSGPWYEIKWERQGVTYGDKNSNH
jgi:hypothetical protein